MRILHISEAFGGGLASAVQQYVRNSSEHEHELAYVFRPEAPINQRDLQHFARAHELHGSHMRRIKQLRTLLQHRHYDLVHAHSAFGGLYARLLPAGLTGPVVYTPHCYAFNRTDYIKVVRVLFRMVEYVLARRTSVVAACSPAEAMQSRLLHGSIIVVEVPNVSPPPVKPLASSPFVGNPMRIVGAGRLNEQKDPLFFLECVLELRRQLGSIEAIWVGDGDKALGTKLIQADIEVTGWVDRALAHQLLTQTDSIYLHTARWEGFPISVLEAASAGVPAFVRSGPAYSGIDLPLFFDSSRHFADIAEEYLHSSKLERTRIISSQYAALAGNTDERQSSALVKVYRAAAASSRPGDLEHAKPAQ